MPTIVGEALVVVRVISDRLGGDIKKAVKDSLNDAGPDIDKQAKASGSRISRSMAQGVKEEMANSVGKEIALSARRFTAQADGAIHDEGDRLGRRFVTGLGDGVNDRSGWDRVAAHSATNFANAMAANGMDRIGRALGDNLTQAVGRGIEDNSNSNIGALFRRAVVRELESGSRGALVRAADVDGNLFMRQLSAGFQRGEADLQNDLRRVFTMRPGDINAIGDGGRSAMRAIESGARAEEPNTRARWGTMGHNAASTWLGSFRGAFSRSAPLLNRAGDDAGNEVDRGLRRRLAADSRGIGSLFGKLGSDLGKEFNLGIGAARMGQAAISALVLIGPSVISGLGAVLTALAGEIVNFAAALGPGIAASLGVAAVGVSTLALNLGLLKLAFSGNTQQAKDFKAQLNTFKETLTSTFAPGVLSGFSDLIAKLKDGLLPAIGPLLKDTGTAMGDIARHIGDVVTSSDNLSRIQGILSTNITFLGNFKDGLAGLTTSFLILFNAAKPVVDMIGNGIKNFGEWASKTLAAKEASGELGAFMDRLVQNFKDFWEFLKNIGVGIANVFRAASGPGRSLFESMSGIAERFVAWTSDTGNQSRMTTFFENARLISQQIFDLFGKIITAGGNAFTNVSTDKLQHFFDTLSSVGASIASVFGQIKTGAGANLAKIFDDIATVLDRAAASGSVVSFANAISTLALALADLVVTLTANPIGAQIAGIGLGFLLFGGIIKTLLGPLLALGQALGSLVFDGLVAGLTAIGAPVAAVLAGIAALVGIFVAAYTQSQALRDEISNLGSLVGGAFSQVWGVIGPKISVLVDKFLALASAIGDRLAPVIAFIGPIVADAIRFIGEILANIIDAIGGFIDIITGILTGNWQLIWQGIVEILGAAWDQIKTIFALGLSIISYVWDLITTIIYNAGQVIWGIITSVWTGIWSFLQTLWNALVAWAVFLWNSFFEAVIQPVINLYNQLVVWFTAFDSWIRGLWNAFIAWVVFLWNSFYDSVIQPVINVYNALVDWFTRADAQIVAIWNGIPAWALGLWNSFFDSVIQPVINVYNNLVQWFTSADARIRAIWDGIPAWAGRLWNSFFDSIIQPVINVYNSLVEWFGRADAWVRNTWSNITDALTHPIQTAAEIITGIVSTITGAVQGTLDFIDRLASAITSIPDVPNPTGSGVAGGAAFGGTSILGPEGISGGIQRMLMEHLIPGLATGGIVSPVQGGSMFRLAEAGRPERVEPLDSSGLSNRDRAMIKSIVASTVSMMSGGGVNVDVRIGERGLDQFVTQTIRREESNTARRAGRVKR